MEVLLSHALTYTTEGDVPVEVVARSLIANERLIREALWVIESSSPGAEISAVRVRVSSISNASPLKQAFAVALFVAFQKDLEREVPPLIEKLTGHAVPEQFHSLLTVLVIMVAMAVITTATERLFPGKEIKKLKKEYEDKLAWFAQHTGADKETIEKAVAGAVTKSSDDKPLLKRAMEFFLPAKLQKGAEILVGFGSGQRVSAEAIDEIPDQINMAPDGSRAAYDMAGVVIDIHRADKDQGKHGWRAVIESVSPKKIRLELDPEIEAETIFHGKKVVIGDVTVIEERGESGDLEPKTYYVRRINEE